MRPDIPPGIGGSIPACAGEPRLAPARCGLWWVYPRVCGGTGARTGSDTDYRGLSPRVRGNLTAEEHLQEELRSIPACAGEPDYGYPAIDRDGVYPRVCGGTGATGWDEVSALGLSPRVRGNRITESMLIQLGGSIPACAGEPHTAHLASQEQPVYPRVCGGTTDDDWLRWTYQGLSPRVRGNLGSVWVPVYAPGSIPACAGEPACGGSGTSSPRVYPRVCGGTPR